MLKNLPPVVALFALTSCVVSAPAEREEDGESGGAAGALSIKDIGIDPRDPPPPVDPNLIDPVDALFKIKPLGNRCVDLGTRRTWRAGLSVGLRDCNNSEGQRIRVRELDLISHDFELRTPLADFCVGVIGGVTRVGAQLELQTCNGTLAQRFAFDGDSLMIGGAPGVDRSGFVSRTMAVEPLDGRTRAGTPLAVANRDFSESQYLRFYAADSRSPDKRPHRGFAIVNSGEMLRAVLESISAKRSTLTVVEINAERPIMIGSPAMKVPKGVTVRGYRQGLTNGPLIQFTPDRNYPEPPAVRSNICDEATKPGLLTDFWPGRRAAFELESDTRLTGLTLRGPDHNITDEIEDTGVLARASGRQIVDHVEITNFAGHGVRIDVPIVENDCAFTRNDCHLGVLPPHDERKLNAEVVSSFLHDNLRNGAGYAVATYNGRYANIRQNTFYRNRHSAAAAGAPDTSYVATDNFVLSPVLMIDGGPAPSAAETDFDMHGSQTSGDGHWDEGNGGDYVELAYNTSLRLDEAFFRSRGYPCERHVIQNNVFLRRRGESHGQVFGDTGPDGSAIVHDEYGTHHSLITLDPNAYSAPNPTNDLGVGDFDGDGVDDLFIGTGTGFFYAPGGKKEWRFLKRASEHASELRFGDFDGDGRTDILRATSVQGFVVLSISWAGISPWEGITYVSTGLNANNVWNDIAVGDFDGDHYSDIFLSNGSNWQVAYGAKWFSGAELRNWEFFRTSGYRASSLKFADIVGPDNGPPDGKTDVIRVGDSSAWQVVSAEPFGSRWAALPGSPGASSSDDLMFADFDGDGSVDVLRTRLVQLGGFGQVAWFTIWELSSKARTDWHEVRRSDLETLPQRPRAAHGRFDTSSPSASVAFWDDKSIALSRGGSSSPQRWSTAYLR